MNENDEQPESLDELEESEQPLWKPPRGSEGPQLRCGQCDRAICLGEDAHELEQGVIGPRGFVPIAATTLLCSEACVRGFVSGTDEQIETRPRRIP